MRFLKRLQEMSLQRRKTLFWIIVIIVGLILLVVFIILTASRLKNFSVNDLKRDMNFPSFEPISPAFPDDSGEQQSQ